MALKDIRREGDIAGEVIVKADPQRGRGVVVDRELEGLGSGRACVANGAERVARCEKPLLTHFIVKVSKIGVEVHNQWNTAQHSKLIAVENEEVLSRVRLQVGSVRGSKLKSCVGSVDCFDET